MKRLAEEISPGWVREYPEGHVLACGDARDLALLRRVADPGKRGRVDLLLTDPPYAVASDNRIELKGRTALELNEVWDRVSPEEMRRIIRATVLAGAKLASSGNVWVWTSDWWLSTLKWGLLRAGFRVYPSYIWAKPNPPQSVRRRCFVSACEFLAFASTPGAYFELGVFPRQRNYCVLYPDGETAPAVSPNWVERAVLSSKERLKRPDGKPLNRAQKPLDLIEAFVRAGAPEGGLVLDPFGGTGTTLVAADRSGRRCVCVERDPEQVRAIARRLARDRRDR